MRYANLINRGGFLTGMVVARFWCDKVEEINRFSPNKINLKGTCISYIEYCKYIGNKVGKAIHIAELEIFDKPKEISEFGNLCTNNCEKCKYNNKYDICNHVYKPLTRAPQSWYYIEV